MYWAMLSLTAALAGSIALQMLSAIWVVNPKMGVLLGLLMSVCVGVGAWRQFKN